MSGIVFPDIAGTLAPILQLESADRRNALEESRQKKIDAEEERLNSVKQYVPGALQGDQDAFNKLAAIHPDMAIKLRGLADQKDAAKLARAKAGAEWLGGAAGGVLSAPPEEKPAAYQQYLADGKARGIDMSTMPQQYSPAVDSTLRYHLNSAVGAKEVFAHLESQPQAMPPVGGAPAGVGNAGNAISGIESKGGPDGGYGSVGPSANAQGDRAYGKYQVMGNNVPAWTQEALGRPMTPQEFLANPQAQDAVFKHKFGQYAQKYGPEGAARAWFAGEGGMNNPNAADVNGMTVQRYGQQFVANGGGGPQVAQAGPGAQPAPGPQMAQAGPPTGAPPGMPVGGDAPVGQPGTMPGAPGGDADMIHINTTRERARGQGGDVFIDPKTHRPEEQDGKLVIRSIANPRQVIGYAPLPPKKEQVGPLAGTGLDAQMHNIILEGMRTGKTDTPEYAAALAHVGSEKILQDPTTGQITRIKPDIGWAAPSTFAGGGVPQPATPPVPGTKGVEVTLGHGKPIPSEENDKLSVAAGAITNIDKAIDTFKTGGAKAGSRTAGFVSRNVLGGDLIAQTMDSEGTTARALLASVDSQLLQAKSGLAVTEAEYRRLTALLPVPSDDPKVIVEKLQQVRSELGEVAKNRAAQYTAKNGFIPHEGITRLLGGAAPAAASAAPPATQTPQTGAAGPKMSPEEASKLPPGTPFIGLDGQPYTRN